MFLGYIYLKYDCSKFSILFMHIFLLLHTFFVFQILSYSCHSIPNELKFDCLPKGESNQAYCEQINCCWTPANQSFTQWPWCYYPECYNNYNTINVSKTNTGVTAFYNLTTASKYKNDVQILRLDVIFETSQRLRITVCFLHYLVILRNYNIFNN